MLQAIWYVVSNDDVFSSAATSVSNRECVVYWIAWANFIRTAEFACQDWFCAEERAEANWCSSCAEASALLAFAFALHPNFRWSAFAFSHWTEVPSDFTAFNFRFWLASDERNAFWKVSCNNNIANIITCSYVKIQRILIAKHAKVRVTC